MIRNGGPNSSANHRLERGRLRLACRRRPAPGAVWAAIRRVPAGHRIRAAESLDSPPRRRVVAVNIHTGVPPKRKGDIRLTSSGTIDRVSALDVVIPIGPPSSVISHRIVVAVRITARHEPDLAIHQQVLDSFLRVGDGIRSVIEDQVLGYEILVFRPRSIPGRDGTR